MERYTGLTNVEAGMENEVKKDIKLVDTYRW